MAQSSGIDMVGALTELLQGRALDSLEGFPEPGFDMEEITLASNLEIHFVDSSGVISWNFLRDTPDFPFADWNFSTTTAEDYAWLCDCIAAEGKDVYVADFAEQGAYSCRILVPGMSEIYPVEDVDAHLRSLRLLFSVETVRQAQALLERSERFFGLETLGPDMEGSPMHQTLLAAYDKLFAPVVA